VALRRCHRHGGRVARFETTESDIAAIFPPSWAVMAANLLGKRVEYAEIIG